MQNLKGLSARIVLGAATHQHTVRQQNLIKMQAQTIFRKLRSTNGKQPAIENTDPKYNELAQCGLKLPEYFNL
jgi:hypothetical protein